MRSPLLARTAFALAGLTSLAASAQADEAIVMGVRADPRACNQAVAARAEIAGLTAGAEGGTGKCVSVEGFWSQRVLFSDPADAARVDDPQQDEGFEARRIGLYLPDKLMKRAPEKPVRYRIVGVTGDCGWFHRNGLMVNGYCHYTSGPYLSVTEARRIGR